MKRAVHFYILCIDCEAFQQTSILNSALNKLQCLFSNANETVVYVTLTQMITVVIVIIYLHFSLGSNI